MQVKYCSKSEAASLFERWMDARRSGKNCDFPLSENYRKIRTDLLQLYEKAKKTTEDEMKKCPELNRKKYILDCNFGLSLYSYFLKDHRKWFTLRHASNPDFWRYLCVKVVPEIVYDRWNDPEKTASKGIRKHFYEGTTRIYLYSLWWYIYLAWQGSWEETTRVIKSENCSSDTILNLVERSGKKGTAVNLYRTIMKYYSRLPKNSYQSDGKQKSNSEFFRNMMILNTAETMAVIPELMDNGYDGYIRNIYKELNISEDICNSIFRT